MLRRLFFLAAIFIVTFALVTAVSLAVFAWTDPTQSPPNGNVATPINVGSTAQVKSGNLWAASMGTDNGFCIGASCITSWNQAGGGGWTSSNTNITFTGGNVGIGTSSPAYALSVLGTIYTTGGVRFGDGTVQTTAESGGVLNPGTCYDGEIPVWDTGSGGLICDGYQDDPNGNGHFLRTVNTYTGNLGGLSGANAICFSEVQDNDWLGKFSGSIDPAKVEAFLCDGTTCQMPKSNKTYQFGYIENLGVGGDGFTTDSSGRGPGNNNPWRTTVVIGSDTHLFWTNMGSVDSSKWSGSPAGTNHCNNWTSSSSSVNGWYGYVYTYTDARRWDRSTWGCNDTLHLICMVHP